MSTSSLKERCANCGLRKGSHNATPYYSEFYKMFIPYNYCPGDEGRMNWDKGPGTVFASIVTKTTKEEQ